MLLSMDLNEFIKRICLCYHDGALSALTHISLYVKDSLALHEVALTDKNHAVMLASAVSSDFNLLGFSMHRAT